MCSQHKVSDVAQLHCWLVFTGSALQLPGIQLRHVCAEQQAKQLSAGGPVFLPASTSMSVVLPAPAGHTKPSFAALNSKVPVRGQAGTSALKRAAGVQSAGKVHEAIRLLLCPVPSPAEVPRTASGQARTRDAHEAGEDARSEGAGHAVQQLQHGLAPLVAHLGVVLALHLLQTDPVLLRMTGGSVMQGLCSIQSSGVTGLLASTM